MAKHDIKDVEVGWIDNDPERPDFLRYDPGSRGKCRCGPLKGIGDRLKTVGSRTTRYDSICHIAINKNIGIGQREGSTCPSGPNNSELHIRKGDIAISYLNRALYVSREGCGGDVRHSLFQ